MLGAAIMLPDHPQIAPESHGSLFDSTEIEEALLIHVLALSATTSAKRARRSRTRRCAQMLERAARDDAARSCMEPARAGHGGRPARRRAVGRAESSRRRALPARRHGRAAAGRERDAAGPPRSRAAGRPSSASTIDYDGTRAPGVTVDDVPGQDVMRDIGRFLYFKTERGRGDRA